MDIHMIGWLGTIFAGATILNRIAGASLVEAADVAVMNTLTITRDMNVWGLFHMPVLNTDFFFTGIPRLVKWDYSYFGGNAAIIQFMLYAITFAVAFGIVLIFAGVIGQYFSRR